MSYCPTEYGNIELDDFANALGVLAAQPAQDMRSIAWRVLEDLHCHGSILVAFKLGENEVYPAHTKRAILGLLSKYALGEGIIVTPWGRACPHQIEKWARYQLMGGKNPDLLKEGEKGRIRKLENWIHNLQRPNGPENHDGLIKTLESAIIERIKLGHFAN